MRCVFGFEFGERGVLWWAPRSSFRGGAFVVSGGVFVVSRGEEGADWKVVPERLGVP